MFDQELDRMSEGLLFTILAGISIFKHISLILISRRHRKELLQHKTRVGVLSQITVYPVKSMRGINVQTAWCDPVGLRTATDSKYLRDRSIMVCSPSTEGNYLNFVTARQLPRLVLITPSLQDNVLYLNADGMETLKINLENIDSIWIEARVWGQNVEATDCGDVAAEWINRYLGKTEYRILYHSDNMKKRSCSAGGSRWHKNAKDADQVGFQDGFPFMLMSESSVAELNTRLVGRNSSADMSQSSADKDPLITKSSADMAQFRPNLVIFGSEPFDEDQWNELFIGDAVFTNIKPCERCILTTVNTETGEKDARMEPLRTLRSYRCTEPEFGQSPCFGINLVLTKGEGLAVNVGDEIFATRKELL